MAGNYNGAGFFQSPIMNMLTQNNPMANYQMPMNQNAAGQSGIMPGMADLTSLGNNTGNDSTGGSIMQMLFGNPQQGTSGMAMPIVNSLSGLASTYLGMKQYSMAKDAFKESKRQFNLNFDAQKKSYNSSISDRQKARRVSAGDAADSYDTEAQYMKKWGI